MKTFLTSEVQSMTIVYVLNLIALAQKDKSYYTCTITFSNFLGHQPRKALKFETGG